MGSLLTFDALKCLGVDSITEQTDAPKDKWAELAGVVPRPYGAFNRPPIFYPLWGMDNIVSKRAALGLNPLNLGNYNETVALKVSQDGVSFIYFVNFRYYSTESPPVYRAFSRGFFLLEGDGGKILPTGNPTVTLLSIITGPTPIPLVGFDPNRRWRSARALDRIVIGNGVDPNLIYQNGIIRRPASVYVPATPGVEKIYDGPPDSTPPLEGKFKGAYIFMLTYFDSSTDGYGYESGPSPTTRILALDVSLRVDVAGATISTRFDKIRIYVCQYFYQPGVLVKEVSTSFVLLKEVNNADGEYQFTGDEITGAIYVQGAAAPPPCDKFLFTAGRLWMTGNVTKPNQIWYSKPSTNTELVPEGIDPKAFLAVTGNPEEEGARPVVTALHSYKSNIVAHTNKSTCLIDSTTFRRTNARNTVGALNNNCVVGSNLGRGYFLARDFSIYELDAQFNTLNSRRRSVDRGSLGYIRKRLNIEKTVTSPETATLMFDSINNLLWIACNFAVPQALHKDNGDGTVTVSGGAYANADTRLFAMDLEKEELYGPMTAPIIFDYVVVDPTEGTIAFCDPSGQLNYCDMTQFLRAESALTSDPFTPLEGIGYLTPVSPVPSVLNDPQPWASPVGKKPPTTPHFPENFWLLKNGHTMRMETPWMEFGKPSRMKAVYAVELRFAQNSRCSLKVSIFSDDRPIPIYRMVEEIYSHPDPYTPSLDVTLPFAVRGKRIKLVVEMTVGENKPCLLRSLSLRYEVQGEKSTFAF